MLMVHVLSFIRIQAPVRYLPMVMALASVWLAEPPPASGQRAGSSSPDQFRLEMTIGEELAEEAYVFGRIAAIAVGPAGAIYVLDAGAYTVKVYDARGRFQHAFGRQGAGPGELMQPVGMVLDSLVHVFDGVQNRVASFTFSGQHRLTRRLPASEGVNLTRTFPMRHGVAIGVTTPGFSFGSRDHTADVAVVAMRAGSAVVDTLARYHSGGTIWHAAGELLPWGVADSRFGAAGAWAVSGDSLLALADGYSGTVSLLRTTPAGMQLRRRGTLGVSGRPVTTADLRELERDFRRSRQQTPTRIEFKTPPQWSIATRALFAADGALWVENGHGTLSGNYWTRFDFNRASAARIRLPDNFALRAVHGGRLYGIARTENDAQVVHVYRWSGR